MTLMQGSSCWHSSVRRGAVSPAGVPMQQLLSSI
jgi:hypothetical protein